MTLTVVTLVWVTLVTLVNVRHPVCRAKSLSPLASAYIENAINVNAYSKFNGSNTDMVKTYYESSGFIKLDPEVTMNMDEIIRYHGYPVEDHTVQTEDGYIITMQRIPHGKSGSTDGPKKPVIVQHGLLCSSAIWVLNTPDKNLAYILADEGYDVWLTNVRGNDFGRKHATLTPSDKAFWQFSFDEMAQYDMPAQIDYILQKTGFSQTFYVGHSMGTTIAFAMLSSKPEYNAKIRGLMALAPVATVGHIKSPIRLLAPFANDIAFLLNLLGNGEFLADSKVLKFLSATACGSPIQIVCSSVLFVLCGWDLEQLNQTRLPVFLHLTPGGTSVQNVLHYAQMINSKNFQYHDYGTKLNAVKYGQKTPPLYDLSQITANVAMFWSDNDYLADPQDVSALGPKLKNLVLKYRVPFKAFSHIDYMWAIDVKSLVYDKVVSTMNKLWRN